MKRWIGRFVISLAFMFPRLCNAEYEKKSHEPGVLTMEEIVVSATRQEENISSVPANVTVITEKDIGNSTAYDIPDLLRQQAGIHVNDIAGNRRNYTVDLRGFGETASLNTLVLVDGRRINQADLSGTDWALIPLDRVKRIEIVRGGRGSVLYGDNAAGGVINIITRQGQAFKNTAEVQGGSYNTFKGSAHLGGNKNDVSYALYGSYVTSDGYRDNSETEAKDLGFNLTHYSGDWMKLNLSSGFHKDSTGLPGAIKTSDFAAGTSRTDSLHPNDFADVDDYYVKGGPEIYLSDNSKFETELSFRKRSFLSFASFDAGSFTGDTDIDMRTISPRILIREKVWGVANSLIIGLDITDVDEDITNQSIFFGTPSTGKFKLEKRNDGYYIHDEIKPFNKLAISGGYRRDVAEFRFKPSTPEQKKMDEDLFCAGINYNFYKKSYAYLSFSRSFRYPVMDELFNFFTNTIDTALVPQTSDDYEFGVRHHFTESLYADINIFRIDTKNELVYNPTSFANENLDGTTRRDGLEISLSKTFERVSLNGNYTFTDATIKDGQFAGKDFPNIPRHKLALNSLFSLGSGLCFAVNGVYVGERPFISDFSNDFQDQEDYLIINTKLVYNWENITAFFNINNLTDKKYSEYGGISTYPVVETGFYPSPEINFLFGVTVDI